MRILLKNVYVITMDNRRTIIPEGYVLIEKTRVAGVGPMNCSPSENSVAVCYDLKGSVVLPGLVNLHDHPCASLLKSTGRGLLLEDWIPRVALPMIAALDPEILRVGSMYQAAELLLGGITTCFVHPVNENDEKSFGAIVQPGAELGLRQIVAKELRHAPAKPFSPEIPIPLYHQNLEQELSLAERLIKEWEGSFDGLVHMALAIEAGATWILNNATSDNIIRQGHNLASRLGVHVSCHISATPFRAHAAFMKKTALGEIEYLQRLNVLSDCWIFVHGLNVRVQEIDLMAKANCSICHCPVSNAYSADGIAELPKFLDRGVRCGLGTDGAYVCGSMDMFEVMKFCTLIHNVRNFDPGLITPERVLDMATIGAARILGMDSEIGSIEIGKLADLIVLNMKKPSSWPVRDLPAALVFSARGDNVEHVFVNGRHVVRDGQVIGIDREELLNQADYYSRKLVKKAGLEWLSNA